MNARVSAGRKIKDQILLWKELGKAPRAMGTLCASSPFLARTMAAPLKTHSLKGQVVELGAGTGPVTQALLRQGVDKESLVVIEYSSALVQCLKERFQGLNVLCCSAEDLSTSLDLSKPVSAIVSSLPFRSLPKSVAEKIMQEIENVLAPGGLYIQFTYAILGEMPMIPKSFERIKSNVVLCNLPPAKVDVFQNMRTENLRRCVKDETVSN